MSVCTEEDYTQTWTIGIDITTKTLVDTCAQQLFYIPLKNYL